MARDRYKVILRCLHFADEKKRKKDDRLGKIRVVLDELKNANSTNFEPFEHLSIDESLVGFKGRFVYKQYVPLKRARFGIKIFLICHCKTGYVLDCIPYVGKQTDLDFKEDHDVLGQPGMVVAALMKPFFNRGHKLFVDNFYTSPGLAEFLLEKNTNICGTVRENRKGLPKQNLKNLIEPSF